MDQRRDQWALLQRLRAKAAHLDVEAEHAGAINSILESRRLLETPDPVAPIVQEYVSSLRDAIVERYSVLVDALEQAQERSEGSESWNRADAATRERILKKAG